MEQGTDSELLVQVRSGEERALGVLFARHRLHAFHIAARVVGPDDAEDVVGETFVRILGAIRDGGGPTVSFRPYLSSAVHNAAVDWYRRHHRMVATEVDDLVPLLVEADQSGRRARDQVVRDALASLPPRWQHVLWFSEVENHSHQEIGDLLGIAPNAVAALALRARRGLADAYLTQYLSATPSAECKLLAPHLPAYLNGTTTPTRRQALDAHLAHCATCSVALLELEQARTDVAALIAPLALVLAGPPAVAELVGGASGSAAGSVSALTGGAASGGMVLKATAAVTALLVAVGAVVAGIARPRDAPANADQSIVAGSPSEPSPVVRTRWASKTSHREATTSSTPEVSTTPTSPATGGPPIRPPRPSSSPTPSAPPTSADPTPRADPRLTQPTTLASARGTGWSRVKVEILDAGPGVKLSVSATGGTQYCIDACATTTETTTWLTAMDFGHDGSATATLDVKLDEEVKVVFSLTGSGWSDSDPDNNTRTTIITP